jgi:hypothetical protein
MLNLQSRQITEERILYLNSVLENNGIKIHRFAIWGRVIDSHKMQLIVLLSWVVLTS